MPYQPRALDAEQVEPRPTLDDMTVVIPTLGRPILEECLSWIISGSAWPAGLITVDQGSNPKVSDWIVALQSLGIDAEYVPSAERGRAAGLNRGLERVRSRFVAVTDDDCFVETDWIERMVKRVRDNPEAIVTGRVEPAGEALLVAVTSPEPAVYHRPRLKFDSMSGGNMGTSMRIISRVGPFDQDTRLRTTEDAGWVYPALRVGVPLICAPKVVVRQLGWCGDTKRLVQNKDHADNHSGFHGRYWRQREWLIALRALMHHRHGLRRWLRGVMTGNQEMALYGWTYLTEFVPGILAGMRRA